MGPNSIPPGRDASEAGSEEAPVSAGPELPPPQLTPLCTPGKPQPQLSISSAFFPDDSKACQLLNPMPWALAGLGASLPPSPISSPVPRLPWARRQQRPGLLCFLPLADLGTGLRTQRLPWPCPTADRGDPAQRSHPCLLKLPPRIPREPRRKQKALGYLSFFLPGNSASSLHPLEKS